MSHEISISDNGKYIVVRIKEDITHELALKFAQEAQQFGRQHSLSKYFFDVREVENVETVGSNYVMAYEEFPELGFAPESRFAVLVKATDVSHDFIVNATRDAGFTAHIFTREGEAIEWLETL